MLNIQDNKIDEIHYKLLDDLKKDMEIAFPQLRIIHATTRDKTKIDKMFKRLYFSVYYKGDKHEWGEVRMTTYEKYGSDTIHHFIPLLVRDYKTIDTAIVDTHEEVINLFAKYIEKKGNNQISMFDI